jgi:hypothetical protein
MAAMPDMETTAVLRVLRIGHTPQTTARHLGGCVGRRLLSVL